MLKKLKIEGIIPKGDRVLVHIQRLPKTTESGIYVGTTNEFSSTKMDIDNYLGTIVSIGDDSKIQEGCPGIKVGDNVLFSQYAGYHTPTEREVYAKIIGSSEIHSKVKSTMKLKLDEVEPMGPRLLLEIVKHKEEVTEAGIIVQEKESDPREMDSEKCIVRGIGTQITEEYKLGDIVYIPQYVGNMVVLDDGMVVKTVNFNDILFAVK